MKARKEWRFTTKDALELSKYAQQKEGSYAHNLADAINAHIDRLFEKAVEWDLESGFRGGSYDPYLGCFDMKTIANKSKRVIVIPLEPVTCEELERCLDADATPSQRTEIIRRILEYGLEPK